MPTEAEIEGWKEATIAWSVCASIHREYCKGRDPFFNTRQADFIKHENDARERLRSLSSDNIKPVQKSET